MKTRNIFKAAAMMALVLFASCSKEEIKDSQDNGLITLTVPAIQGFGDENAQSRIAFDIPADGSVPKVSWEVGDIIYIGENKVDYAGKKTVQDLVDEHLFEPFECKEVINGKATFQGSILPANSNMAVYAEKDNLKNVVAAKKDPNIGFQCPVIEPINDDNSHLAKNDFLVSNFNTELENNGLKFTRAFGLVEFKFTLPQEEANAVGTFSCDNFRLTARIYNQIDKNGWFSTDGDSKTKFKVDNLKVGTDGTLTFYSLVPKINLKNNPEGSGNFPDVKYVFTIGDKTYTKTINYGRRVDIYPNKATKIAVDFTDQSAQ